VPIDRTRTGGEALGQRAKRQTSFSAAIQELDRGFNDALPGRAILFVVECRAFFWTCLTLTNLGWKLAATIGELMRDGQAMLLDFEGNASLKSLASEYGGRIKYVSGRANEQFGLSAALIRPDGMIAWASDNDPDDSELQKAAARWLMKEPM
jgi:hypothetical protein